MVYGYHLYWYKKDGWIYLASVMDLHSKQSIGYVYDVSMITELAIKAIRNVCLNVKNTKWILLYSDLGVQYTNPALETYLEENWILVS